MLKGTKLPLTARKKISSAAKKRWGDPAWRARRVGNITKMFWVKVDKSGGPGACWIWQGPTYWDGYGKFNYDGRANRAHRIAWRITFGSIPKGKYILHECDNRICVNPKHLKVGTHHDNMIDRQTRGRIATGDNCNNAKGEIHYKTHLTSEDVKEIRAQAASGTEQREIAKQFRISPPTVSSIVNRKTWRHVK